MSANPTLGRVILVGFNKCGTRSLAALFSGSGHRAVHHKIRRPFHTLNVAKRIKENLESGRKALEGVAGYLFYGDLIYLSDSECYEACLHFEEIARDYPDTIFILNTRRREDWIRSRLNHGHGEFLARSLKAHGLRDQSACEGLWREMWDQHLRAARAYLRDHPQRMIEFNIDTDDINDLIRALPQYHLRIEFWFDHGRSRGRNTGSFVNQLKRVWSHLRPRSY